MIEENEPSVEEEIPEAGGEPAPQANPEETAEPDVRSQEPAAKTFSQAEVDEIVQRRTAISQRRTERKFSEQLQRLEEKIGQGQQQPTVTAGDQIPTWESGQYADYAQFELARTQWAARQEFARLKAEDDRRKLEETQRSQLAERQSRVARYQSEGASKYGL